MKNSFLAIAILFTFSASNAQVKIGQAAPEISLPGTNDSTIKLSSLIKDKVVLIDFWASWCGPCRATNPYVANLYKKYKDEGFEVLGVSIDSKKENWLKAIKKDKINYVQVNDNSGWNSSIAEQYGVNAIPSSFLLDKAGNIVAIDEYGPALERKIRQLLN